MAAINPNNPDKFKHLGPRIEHSYTLHFVGDWGMANSHRICSWLSQQFCDRAGPDSRTAIWSIRYGGIEAVTAVARGEAHLAIATPAQMISTARTGEGIFALFGPMPSLRVLGTIPQNDRVVLAIHPKYGISSFEELRRRKPALRIATSCNDATNFIGYTAFAYLRAHGIPEDTITAWGGEVVTMTRPEQATGLVLSGEADAVLPEAIMTPWWRSVIEEEKFVPLPLEPEALTRFLEENPGSTVPDPQPLPAGFWKNLAKPLPALDFSDFVVLVREDLPEEVAHLLTWCLVETRECIEQQYRHLDPTRSPLSYPLVPHKMARAAIPLHPGAEKFYRGAGYL